MRTFLPAALACLALASLMGGWLIAAAAAPGSSSAKTPAPPPAPLPAAQKAATAPASIDNDAPARHLKRTACLKDAKTKKLVGAQRTAYVKGCMGAS
jgi:psiF repeat